MDEKEFLKGRGIDPEMFKMTEESVFQVHMINLAVAIIMIGVGMGLLYRTRKQKSSGKKTVGWILIGLGIAVSVTHIFQMIL